MLVFGFGALNAELEDGVENHVSRISLFQAQEGVPISHQIPGQ
jgi:hypothetical protein